MGYLINKSDYLDYAIASNASAVKAGDVLSFNSGGLIGVAVVAGQPGETIPACLFGKYSLSCGASAFSCTQGAPAYWDSTNSKVIATVGSGKTAPQIGVFAETLSSSTSGEVRVLIFPTAITKTGA